MFRDVGIKFASDERLCDLVYSSGLVCLLPFAEYTQHAPGGLTRVVAAFGMCFAPSKRSSVIRLEGGITELSTE